MKEIIVLSGVPGAGKSYLSQQIVKKYSGDTVIINNDCLRQMLSGHTEANVKETYSLDFAGKLTEWINYVKEMTLINLIAREDISRIVVDACHFEPQNLLLFEAFSSAKKAKVTYVLLDTEPAEALKNAQSRVRIEDEETISFINKKLKTMNYSYDFVLRNREEVAKFLENI